MTNCLCLDDSNNLHHSSVMNLTDTQTQKITRSTMRLQLGHCVISIDYQTDDERVCWMGGCFSSTLLRLGNSVLP